MSGILPSRRISIFSSKSSSTADRAMGGREEIGPPLPQSSGDLSELANLARLALCR